VTSHPGKLSLAIPLCVGAMSTSQRGGDALQLGSTGRYGSCVGGSKTVRSHCYTRAIEKRANNKVPYKHMGHRDKGLIIKCHINSSVYIRELGLL